MSFKTIVIASSIVLISIALPSIRYANGMDEIHRGKQLFKKYCAACHGENAIGQNPIRPSGGWDAEGNRLAPALDVMGHTWHHPPESLLEYIKKGSSFKTSPMPSFSAVLNDAQIKGILTYIHSLWPDKIKTFYKKKFGVI